MAVSPAGTRVFVTGYSFGGTAGRDYATVAYGAAAGRRLWVSRYTGPGSGVDEASSVAVSPGGARVFVTGVSSGRKSSAYATVAYGAAAGRRLWVSRYNGPANSSEASSVAVSPAGTTVYVTGTSLGRTAGDDYATVAYGAAAGRRLWVSRYNGPGNGEDQASAVAVSPGGTTVYVTGSSDGGSGTQVCWRAEPAGSPARAAHAGPIGIRPAQRTGARNAPRGASLAQTWLAGAGTSGAPGGAAPGASG